MDGTCAQIHFLTHIIRIGSQQTSAKHPAYASFWRKFGPNWQSRLVQNQNPIMFFIIEVGMLEAGAHYARPITTCFPEFSDFATTLYYYLSKEDDKMFGLLDKVDF